MARLLYIDVPFENEAGGDKNRSRFLWDTLREAHETDLLLVHPTHAKPGPRPAFDRFPPVLELPAGPPRWLESDSVFGFAAPDLERFDRLLAERRYDAVVARFHAPWVLARRAERHPTRPAVVVDLDMISSRLVGLTWHQEPAFRNRWFLIESIKLAHLERQLLRRPWLVLFSNPAERDDALDRIAPPQPPGHLEVLPNVMPPPAASPATAPGRDLLFFGSLNSAANTDAFRYLVEDLLPRLDADLHQYDAKIRVAGKNPPAWFEKMIRDSGSDRVVLLGGVESMERTIAECSFVLLPLRVASGTRTRILEAAAVRRTVVTTPLGAEGIEVGSDALLAEDAAGLADATRRLLEQPALAVHLGHRLHDRCRARYDRAVVAADLLRELGEFLARRRPGGGPQS